MLVIYIQIITIKTSGSVEVPNYILYSLKYIELYQHHIFLGIHMRGAILLLSVQARRKVVQPVCSQGQRDERGQHLQHWLCNLSVRASGKESGVSVTSASARRQQYLSAFAGGVVQFAPSWPGQGP